MRIETELASDWAARTPSVIYILVPMYLATAARFPNEFTHKNIEGIWSLIFCHYLPRHNESVDLSASGLILPEFLICNDRLSVICSQFYTITIYGNDIGLGHYVQSRCN